VSPLRGEKPQNRPVSKRNTGRAALRADPAGNDYFESLQYRQDVRQIAHYHKKTLP